MFTKWKFRGFHLPWKIRLALRLLRVWPHRLLINSIFFMGKRWKPRAISYEKAVILHQQYVARDVYKYDLASKKKRADRRFRHLCSIIDMTKVKNVAELGAGDGQLGLRFADEGFRVQILDIEDWRDQEVKRDDIIFHQITDGSNYGISDNSIDLFVSYLTLEHVSDPVFALNEMIRTTRPGGIIRLYFGPLFNSAWGLHAYRTFYAPYPQFLFEKNSLQKFIDKDGIYDLGSKRKEFQFVNKCSLSDYENLIARLSNKIIVKVFSREYNFEGLGVVYRNLECFWGRNLSFDELTVEALDIILGVK